MLSRKFAFDAGAAADSPITEKRKNSTPKAVIFERFSEFRTGIKKNNKENLSINANHLCMALKSRARTPPPIKRISSSSVVLPLERRVGWARGWRVVGGGRSSGTHALPPRHPARLPCVAPCLAPLSRDRALALREPPRGARNGSIPARFSRQKQSFFCACSSYGYYLAGY